MRTLHSLLAVTLLAACVAVHAQADPRYCGPPARDSDGRIARSAAVRAEFKRIHPCPSTGKPTGACFGWAVDHVIPLACGGCDSVVNMQWLPIQTKSASGALAKDRFERRIYCPTKG